MKNVEIKIEGNIMTITVDLSKTFGPSKAARRPRLPVPKGIKPWPQAYSSA